MIGYNIAWKLDSIFKMSVKALATTGKSVAKPSVETHRDLSKPKDGAPDFNNLTI